MGQRNEAEVGGDTRDIRLAGSMSVMAILQQQWAPTSLDLYWERTGGCRGLSRTSPELTTFRSFGAVAGLSSGEEADELRRVVLGLLNETQRAFPGNQ